MGLLEATNVEISTGYIGYDEKEVLREMFSLCMFMSKAEKTAFWNKVKGAASASDIDLITEDNFPKAFYKAQEILHKRGEAVFKSRGVRTFDEERRGHARETGFSHIKKHK